MAKYGKKHQYHKRYLPVGGHLVIDHPLYGIWCGMIDRCENMDNPAYANYGGRGISVCARWRGSFATFVADMGPRPSDEHQIDRWPDNDAGYSPDNCRWATKSQQMHNRRTFANNTTGERGVVALKNGRFNARWNNEGTRYNLGSFESAEAARTAIDTFVILFATDPTTAMKMTERRARHDSATGVKGITTHSDGGFVVRKTVAGVRKYLGYRKTFEEAMALWTAHN
jgi:hypothetical protein